MAQAQVIDPCPDELASIMITKQPTSSAQQQVTTELKWTNNANIKKIKVRMLKKDTCGAYTVEIGSKTITTMQATSSTTNPFDPNPTQAANTKVKIEIKTYAMDGTLIKEKTSDVVTLP